MANPTKNYKYCLDAISLKNDLERGFMTLAEKLYAIKQKELYRPSWDSWEAYVCELKMSTNKVNKLVQAYADFVLTYHIAPERVVESGGWSVICELLPVISSQKEAVEWLDKARELTRDDLRKEITEKKTGIPMKECKHRNTYTIVVCRDCGIRMEEHK